MWRMRTMMLWWRDKDWEVNSFYYLYYSYCVTLCQRIDDCDVFEIMERENTDIVWKKIPQLPPPRCLLEVIRVNGSIRIDRVRGESRILFTVCLWRQTSSSQNDKIKWNCSGGEGRRGCYNEMYTMWFVANEPTKSLFYGKRKNNATEKGHTWTTFIILNYSLYSIFSCVVGSIHLF
jgi:hypothetical protein